MTLHPATDDIIEFLNQLLALDPGFTAALVDTRLPCNSGVVDHPTIQAGIVDDVAVCGILGLLNGFAGRYEDGPRAGWGPICAQYDGGKLIGFGRVPNGDE
ncbi:hypothetical protein K9B35_14335 [Sphingomonas sp. R647]|uniref:hypothetical protein n=1 Tax=Sphingomonas sp. R647 TaxID=2875233 RepID=UPI001CD54A49|nr:hypothetical protein [Sphingomonas sp. R647]MCA1199152.1 hypothetical protein [Sphingomonas sp. R647]